MTEELPCAIFPNGPAWSMDADEIGHDGGIAVRDIPERPRVDEDGRVFERLHEVRFERVAQDRRHRARGFEIARGHGCAIRCVSNDDPLEPRAQIGIRGREREDRHHFRCGRDVEARLSDDAVEGAAEPDDDVSQTAIVDVEHAAPGDIFEIESACVALVEMVVDECREHVVRGGDGVEVTRKMEVEEFHRNDLAIAAARSAALNAEGRPERGLTDRDRRALADVLHRLAEADGRCRLAFAEWRRRDRRDDDVFRARTIFERVDYGEFDLRDAIAVGLEECGRDPHFARDIGQRQKFRRL